jgi:hypothetical protein
MAIRPLLIEIEMIIRQKENARGERAFSIVYLGVVGVFFYPRDDLGGLVKSLVNSQNP